MMDIRFSRHAKNKLRLYQLITEDIVESIQSGERFNQGNKIESHYGNLRVVWTMVGPYAFVITVIKTK